MQAISFPAKLVVSPHSLPVDVNELSLNELEYLDDPFSFEFDDLDVLNQVNTNNGNTNKLNDTTEDNSEMFDFLSNPDFSSDDISNIEDVSCLFDDLVSESLEFDDPVDLNEGEETKTLFTPDQSALMKELDLSAETMIRILRVAQPNQMAPKISESSPKPFLSKKHYDQLDTRIPCIAAPKIDNYIPSLHIPINTIPNFTPMNKAHPTMEKPYYHPVHNRETCRICLSDKPESRKRILHRYHEKRQKRNWKRGPRYIARSSVAVSRVRTNGRFVACTKWSNY